MKKPKVKIFKKGLSIILILSILGLSGCKSKANDSTSSDTTSSDTTSSDITTSDTITNDTITNDVSVEDSTSPTSGSESDVSSERQTGEQKNQETVNTENMKYADTAENKIENLFGTWYINSTNATIWFNELSYEYDKPSSDFTIKNFNLETFQVEPTTDNRTYFLEDDIICFDTYSGVLSFSYQCYNDGSIILTDIDNGNTMTLTSEMGLSGDTITELVGGHKYGHRMGNESWGSFMVSGNVLAWEGGIVYFTNPGDNDYLYCCNEDGSDQRLMVKLHTQDINIMDGWVYFTGYDKNNRVETSGIYKMKLDGSELHKLDGLTYAYALSIVDETLYFTALTNEGNSLYQADLDGKNVKKIANLEEYGDYLIVFHIYGEYAYFTYANVSGATILYYSLMRVLLSDGTVETVLPRMSSDSFSIDKDGIFAIVGQDIYHYDMNGANEAKLIDCCTDYVIKIGEKLIYYSGFDTQIVSVIDLKNPTTILDYAGKVCYTDNYLYFYDKDVIQAVAYQ